MAFTDSELTEEKKLIWAGLKRAQADLSAVQKEIDKLKKQVGDFSTFQSDVAGLADYDALQTYLESNGFSTEEATAFIDKIQNSFASFSDFQTFLSGASSYEELQNKFGTLTTVATEQKTEDGEPVAGIRVHDTAGVSFGGVSVEAGTTEIFGRRIELSQQAPARAEDGTISYANLDTDDPDNVVTVNASIEISADVTNSNSGDRRVTVALTRDGSVVQEQTVDLNGGETRNVAFTESYGDYVCYDYSIGGLSPVTVCWAPAGLTGF